MYLIIRTTVGLSNIKRLGVLMRDLLNIDVEANTGSVLHSKPYTQDKNIQRVMNSYRVLLKRKCSWDPWECLRRTPSPEVGCQKQEYYWNKVSLPQLYSRLPQIAILKQFPVFRQKKTCCLSYNRSQQAVAELFQ